MAASSLELQLRDYRLTTAEILYHFPDHPVLLQSFVWQELDLAPKFPTLKKFLDGAGLDKLFKIGLSDGNKAL